MHERAWVDGLIRRVSAIARGEGATRVVGVTVRVGPGSALSEQLVREQFESAARGTIVEGARLTVNATGERAAPTDGAEVLESIEIET
jgi:Zn finger protein HypA/HybF involved in hydrogenase expression